MTIEETFRLQYDESFIHSEVCGKNKTEISTEEIEPVKRDKGIVAIKYGSFRKRDLPPNAFLLLSSLSASH